MKTCLIRQPAGIGDLIFSQKIGFYYKGLGYRVVWPVTNFFSYIPDYMPSFEFPNEDSDFEFKHIYSDMSIKEIVENDDYLFIPLNGHNLRNQSVMASKYNLVNLPWEDWKKYVFINRKVDKENELYYDVLGLKDGEEYRFINYSFASPPSTLKMRRLNLKPGIKEVEMFLEDYTLFDWIKVIENATEICMTDSSPALLVELYNRKIKDLICILRGSHTLDVDTMYRLPWKYAKGVWE